MRVVNMAHGAYYLFGGYIGLTITRYTGSFALGVLGGGLSVIPLGYLIDRFLIRRTGENHLAQVLLTVGIAFVLGDVALKIWGGDNLKVPTPIELRGAIELPGGIVYPTYRFVLILFGIVVGLSLWLLYRKTQIGAVVRAGVDDREMVSATGINIDRLFVLVSALASFLAGIAGVVGRGVPHALSRCGMGNFDLCAGGRDLRRARKPGRSDDRRTDRRPARCLRPVASS